MKVQMHISAEAISIQVSQTGYGTYMHANYMHYIKLLEQVANNNTHTTLMQTLQALTLIAVTLSLVIIKQVCVEPPPSALNMTLPAAADRVIKAIDLQPACGTGSSQSISAARCSKRQMSINGTDRRMDGHSYIDPAPHLGNITTTTTTTI